MIDGNELRTEFALYLSKHTHTRWGLDAALMHVCKIAFDAGLAASKEVPVGSPDAGWMAEFERLLEQYEESWRSACDIGQWKPQRDALMAHVETMRNEGNESVHFTGHNMLAAAPQPVAIARVTESGDYEAKVQWLLNPLPVGAILYEEAQQPVGEFCTDYHCPGDCGLSGQGYQHAPQPLQPATGDDLAVYQAIADNYFADTRPAGSANVGGFSYEASMLRNLLARIHGDGGQYVNQHGLDKAIEDAELLVAQWRSLQPVGEVQTGHAEADRILGRLMSSDPDFQDCADAARLIQQEIKGPDGFATWRDAAIAERLKRTQPVGEVPMPRAIGVRFDGTLLHKEVDVRTYGEQCRAAGYAAGVAAGGKDAERLDWLSRQFVTVQIPLRFGTKACFTGFPVDGDGESEPWDIRAEIDAALRGEVKPAGKKESWLCLLCKSSTEGKHGYLDDLVTPCPNREVKP